MASVLRRGVELGDEDIDEMHYMTQAQAAEYLDITPSRVNALVRSGKLSAKQFGKYNKVSIESLNKYMKSPRKAGRPRKSS